VAATVAGAANNALTPTNKADLRKRPARAPPILEQAITGVQRLIWPTRVGGTAEWDFFVAPRAPPNTLHPLP
jgi:hypothetical protein